MANTDKAAIIKLCNSINKKEGEGAVYSIGSKNANLKINFTTSTTSSSIIR
mgnify:CR=1 FL=1